MMHLCRRMRPEVDWGVCTSTNWTRIFSPIGTMVVALRRNRSSARCSGAQAIWFLANMRRRIRARAEHCGSRRVHWVLTAAPASGPRLREQRLRPHMSLS